MASTFTKILLSGSSSGRPIGVTATATPGVTLHTATSAAATNDAADEVWIWAGNTHTSAVNLTLHWGAITSKWDYIDYSIPAAYNGPVCVAAGWTLQNGMVVTATASHSGHVSVWGYVNRVSA